MIRYRLNKGFISQKVGDEQMIFDPAKSNLYNFNKTASFIFNKFKLGWDETRIISGIIKKYKISEKEAKKDIKDFFSELKARKIIVSAISKK